MAECDQNGKRRRIVSAPAPSQPRLLSAVLDVECAEDEEVVWHYTTTLEGRFVSGYSIVPRVSSELLGASIDELLGLNRSGPGRRGPARPPRKNAARVKRRTKSQQKVVLQRHDGIPSPRSR